MNLEDTLEEDILKACWEAGVPLSALEIWEALDNQNIKIPIHYLHKVIKAMVRMQLLKQANEKLGNPTYCPALSIFRFYRSLLKAIQIHYV